MVGHPAAVHTPDQLVMPSGWGWDKNSKPSDDSTGSICPGIQEPRLPSLTLMRRHSSSSSLGEELCEEQGEDQLLLQSHAGIWHLPNA